VLWFQRLFNSSTGTGAFFTEETFSVLSSEFTNPVQSSRELTDNRLLGSLTEPALAEDQTLSERLTILETEVGRSKDVVDTDEMQTLTDTPTLNESNGIWAPTVTGLVIVGAATITGKYRRFRNFLSFDILITPTLGSTTASTFGVTEATDLPYTAESTSIFLAGGVISGGLGQGLVAAGTRTADFPSWTTTSEQIVLTGIIPIQEG